MAEVAAELGRRVSADPAALYGVSREVVTGELARVKQGLEAAPIEILVARAEERFRAVHRVIEAPKQPDLFAPPPTPAAAARPPKLEPPVEPTPVLPVPYEPSEEPFAAATSADLGWERSSSEVPAPGGEPMAPISAAEEELRVEPPPEGAAHVVMGETPEERAPDLGVQEEKDSRRSLWILAVAAVLVVAGGLFWVVVKLLAPSTAGQRGAPVSKVLVPTPPVLPPESAQAVAPAPAPAVTTPPRPAATPAPAPAAKATKAKAATSPPSGRVASFVTRDWAGRSPVFVVHFASHQDRAAAAADASALAKRLGKPARAVEVDLGPKGIWYRVVAGEFPTAAEARAYRAELEAKRTPGMGFVYEMRGGR